MNEQNPYETLGITKDSSFEDIQNARSRLTQQYREDAKRVERIEAAYDAIIMDRLKMRQEGKIKVPDRIRFPERNLQPPKTVTPMASESSSNWLQQFIDTPSRNDILWPSGVFLGLAVLTLLAQGSQMAFLPFALALGFCANLYFLNRKEKRFGRALLMTLVAFVVGLGVGGLLSGLMSTPTGNGGIMPIEFAELVTFMVFWLTSSFLR
ncbi:CPP1-like family protein [Spirulina sp. CS-785/01]|uniref:CPP1-like family protein n=1 Tax=Spirulina sp. CS-785/01 TaxID=3021716 RepID=UPI00232ADA54|nr:CPP1-like family protein [Spirulina sp. CS-785/01]MDB9312388.1 CPP1-like family protein [Spirulina sp. CS-785/01]